MLKLKAADLTLFEGEGGGNAGAGAEGATSNSGDLSNVIYGKQADNAQEAASDNTGNAAGSEEASPEPTQEERRKAYKELVNGQYKDFYTEDTQKMINQRFKETKNLEEKLQTTQPILDLLAQKYKVENGDMEALTKAIENDDAYWEDAAYDAGMSVEQYKQMQKLERQNKALLAEQQQAQEEAYVNQQLKAWNDQAEEAKQRFPELDLATEVQDPNFFSMLKAGVPVEHAYKVVHMEDIERNLMLATQQATEKKVADNIRAKGSRPVENGTTSQSGFVTKTDVHQLTKKDRAEIARRSMKGDLITF